MSDGLTQNWIDVQNHLTLLAPSYESSPIFDDLWCRFYSGERTRELAEQILALEV